MKNQSQIANRKSQILIVGAGPAGASLAIRLAKANFDVVLIEREKFPRQKLCGEFISPECLPHFEELGVLDEMLSIGGDRIAQTCFYEPGGKSVSVQSEWFGGGGQGALSISRAEMDFRLLEKAKQAGVTVLEEARIVELLFERTKVCGVKVKSRDGGTREMPADLTVDATGRANVLGKLAERFQIPDSRFLIEAQQNGQSGIWNLESGIKKDRRSKLVGFKSHLENANLEKGRCEIYFFRGGYGGLSRIENGLANHCFLVKADLVREFSGDADKIVEKVVFQNKRAFETLRDAKPVHDWLAVSVDGFGAKNLNPLPNLFAVGDAAAFIDPFTGSGMLMAFESAKLLAGVVAENSDYQNREHQRPAKSRPLNCRKPRADACGSDSERIAENYKILHRRKFQNRLRICGLMRRAAFVPNLAKYFISALSYSEKAREILARSTRQSFSMKGNKS